ncbi:hypothetical protein [Acaryochloris sp. IP29b_bin.137]
MAKAYKTWQKGHWYWDGGRPLESETCPPEILGTA